MNFEPFVVEVSSSLPELAARARLRGLAPAEAWNVLVVAALRAVLRELAREKGRDPALLCGGRLFAKVAGFEADGRDAQRAELLAETPFRLQEPQIPWKDWPVEAFGQLYESLLALRPHSDEPNLRKRTGSYYTPEALTREVATRAFDGLVATLGDAEVRQRPLRILDPALGAGAFLVEAARQACTRSGRPIHEIVQSELFGVDVSPLAVAAAEASLWLLADHPSVTLESVGQNLREGDALVSRRAGALLGVTGVDWEEGSERSFDLVIGNPPWVAFAGRATQPLPPALREHYRLNFKAFRGYPTLHALFVELAARLSPRGVVALLVPSPIADLDGYRPMREALAVTHSVREPLLELGQDAFASVTQPCFALVAVPRAEPEAEPGRSFVLSERQHVAATAAALSTPRALARLTSLPRFPSELFGEMGLQTNSVVTRELLYRGSTPPPEYSYPLLEGRNIAEFRLSAPRLFLKPDAAVLAAQRCRLREVSAYARVKLVVRQTAALTIAAAHDGTPFRNSLLAGFELPELPALLTLGLLNSTLYRALHLASRRDARQGAFPQVKVAHLRALPAPPSKPQREQIAELALLASSRTLDAELRRALDAAVFEMFQIEPEEADEIVAFVRELAPAAGLTAPLPQANAEMSRSPALRALS
jgi:hypothetical protein